MNVTELQSTLENIDGMLPDSIDVVVRDPSGIEMVITKLVLEIPSDGQNQLVLEVCAK